MDRERRSVTTRIAVVAILLLALGVVLLATLAGYTREPGGSEATGSHAFRPPVAGAGGTAAFAVNGRVARIAIGVWKPVVVTITNDNAFAIRVTRLTVTVTGNPPGCPAADNFQTRPAAAPFTVPPRAVAYRVPARKRPRIRLANRPTNQDRCKGRSFGLVFRGTARKLP
jgi:hypothetical protein